jgi:hypothetical protein
LGELDYGLPGTGTHTGRKVKDLDTKGPTFLLFGVVDDRHWDLYKRRALISLSSSILHRSQLLILTKNNVTYMSLSLQDLIFQVTPVKRKGSMGPPSSTPTPRSVLVTPPTGSSSGGRGRSETPYQVKVEPTDPPVGPSSIQMELADDSPPRLALHEPRAVSPPCLRSAGLWYPTGHEHPAHRLLPLGGGS